MLIHVSLHPIALKGVVPTNYPATTEPHGLRRPKSTNALIARSRSKDVMMLPFDRDGAIIRWRIGLLLYFRLAAEVRKTLAKDLLPCQGTAKRIAPCSTP